MMVGLTLEMPFLPQLSNSNFKRSLLKSTKESWSIMEMKPITNYKLTDHAKGEMVRRGIAEGHVATVLAEPEQTETIREGREVYQSRFQFGVPSKTYLIRVFVDIDRNPPEVVTVYRTSKVTKYWR